MSHHGNDDEQLRAKMNHDDAGGIAMAVGASKAFFASQAEAWVGFTAGELLHLRNHGAGAWKTVSKLPPSRLGHNAV